MKSIKSNQIKPKAPKSEVQKQTVARDFNARRTRATERHRDDDDDDDDGTGRFKRTSASDRAIERVAVDRDGETTRTVTRGRENKQTKLSFTQWRRRWNRRGRREYGWNATSLLAIPNA